MAHLLCGGPDLPEAATATPLRAELAGMPSALSLLGGDSVDESACGIAWLVMMQEWWSSWRCVGQREEGLRHQVFEAKMAPPQQAAPLRSFHHTHVTGEDDDWLAVVT